MTNTYIQDKLDFEDFLMNRCPAHTNNSADGYERWLENMDIDLMIDYANEFKNDALTDYHNHIVEKIKQMLSPGQRKYLDDFLQDTNPKE